MDAENLTYFKMMRETKYKRFLPLKIESEITCLQHLNLLIHVSIIHKRERV
jgi:hypothetical protein